MENAEDDDQDLIGSEGTELRQRQAAPVEDLQQEQQEVEELPKKDAGKKKAAISSDGDKKDN